MRHADNRPLISFVVAMTPDRVIGRDNQLPWHIPADLAHFKRLTIGKPVVMGRRTFSQSDDRCRSGTTSLSPATAATWPRAAPWPTASRAR